MSKPGSTERKALDRQTIMAFGKTSNLAIVADKDALCGGLSRYLVESIVPNHHPQG